jgi:hypothetical protein
VGCATANQCLDDLTQSGKGQVDIDALLGATARGLSLLLPFRAGQIDQVKFASLDFGLSVDDLLLLYPDHEDAVRPGGIFIHLGRAHVSVLASDQQLLIHVGHCLHHLRTQVFHVYSLVFVLVDLQFVGFFRKEVNYLFVVQF